MTRNHYIGGRAVRSAVDRRVGFALLTVGSIVALTGCGQTRSDMFHVTGDVSFDGAPVSAGYMLLRPDAKAGNDGLQAYVEIEEGRFDTAHRGKGVTGGPYVATVHGFDGAAEAGAPRRLFAPYTTNVTIERDTPEVDIEVPSSHGEGRLPPPPETT